MFQFEERFDHIVGENGLSLSIIEKNPGDDVMIPFYWYHILFRGTPIGKISIRIGHNYHSYYNGNVGYEIDPSYRGHRFSLEALKLVLPVAKSHGRDRIYLTCAAENIPSRRIIELSGATLLEKIAVPEDYFGWYPGIPEHLIFELKI